LLDDSNRQGQPEQRQRGDHDQGGQPAVHVCSLLPLPDSWLRRLRAVLR
jgi:hypothetical protein